MLERKRTSTAVSLANNSDEEESSNPPKTMVQVRRRRATGEFGFLNEMTFARHIMHVMVAIVILLCFVSYRILLNQEVSLENASAAAP
jgi:hypothetical protein